MNGLLQQAQPQQAPQQPQQEPQQGGGMAEGYQKFSTQLAEWIYSEDGISMIAQAFRESGDVSQAIPVIVSRLFQTVIEQSGGQAIPPDFLGLAMVEITAIVIELAIDAGLLQEGDAEMAGPELFRESAMMLDKNVGGKIDPEQRNQIGQLFAQVMGGNNATQGGGQ